MPKKLRGNLIMINVPSGDVAKTAQFYSQFLGIDLARSLYDKGESYHAPVSEDGLDIAVNAQHTPEEQPMAFWAVDNLDKTLQDVRNGGAEVVWGPDKLPIASKARDEYKKLVKEEWPELKPTDDLGTAAIIEEPGGTQVGLVQLAESAHGHFNDGKFAKGLTDKQVKVHEKAMKLAQKMR